MLYIAAGALFAYGFFAGVIVPKANIFPASVLNAGLVVGNIQSATACLPVFVRNNPADCDCPCVGGIQY